jgi:hypothetical protein
MKKGISGAMAPRLISKGGLPLSYSTSGAGFRRRFASNGRRECGCFKVTVGKKA